MPLGFSQHLKTGATLVRVKLKSLKIHHPPPDLEDLGDVWEIWGVNTILPRKGFLTWETYRIHQGFGWRHTHETNRIPDLNGRHHLFLYELCTTRMFGQPVSQYHECNKVHISPHFDLWLECKSRKSYRMCRY